jgi:hypothetical protein
VSSAGHWRDLAVAAAVGTANASGAGEGRGLRAVIDQGHAPASGRARLPCARIGGPMRAAAPTCGSSARG